jgi:hypothetical protein
VREPGPPKDTEDPSFSDALKSAIRYWEPRRLIYNLALCLVVAVDFLAAWPDSKSLVGPETFRTLFWLGVLANVSYGAAYAADLIVPLAITRAAWASLRGCVLVLGTAFAAAIAHSFAEAMLRSGGD